MCEFLSKPLGAGEPNTPTFTDDPLSDYVADTAIESSLILDGNQLDMWYHSGDNLKYASTTDPDLQVWTLAPEVDLANYYYPAVAKKDGVYYLATCSSRATQGDIYLFSSNDKRTWAIMNSGNPVYSHIADANSPLYNLYNSSLLFVGETLYLALESQSSTGAYRINLASSTLAALDFSNMTEIISGAVGIATPDMHYIPERDVYVIFASIFVAGKFRISMWYAPGTSDLFDPLSWIQTRLSYGHDGVHTADVCVIELPAYYNHRLLLSYNYDQSSDQAIRESNTLSQAFSELTLVQLYDALVKDL